MIELLLRVNGVQPAFGFEFGLDSPRANEGRAGDPYRQANVSYSLVQRQEGQVVRHTLIDCGVGVVPSLLEFEHSHGPLTQDQFRQELQRLLPDRHVEPTRHGMILGDDEPWPD